jgi:hypothetical protein
MLPPKPSKDVAFRYLQRLLPEYGELLGLFEKDGGWVRFQDRFYQALETLKIADYAKLYTDESIILKLLAIAIFDLDELKRIDDEMRQVSDQERTAFLDRFFVEIEAEDFDKPWEFEIPETPEELERARQQFETLEEPERAEQTKQAQCLFAFVMLHFHNLLAVMVHGRKLTQLVAEAIAGDDDAFVLAVQIDRTALRSIPYFQMREAKAYQEGDEAFIEKLTRRLNAPPIRGRIRFRMLYLLFAMLDSLGLLEDLKHREILDICDAAGLDRWQNRIEDVNCLSKRLAEYRRFQRHKSVY